MTPAELNNTWRAGSLLSLVLVRGSFGDSANPPFELVSRLSGGFQVGQVELKEYCFLSGIGL